MAVASPASLKGTDHAWTLLERVATLQRSPTSAGEAAAAELIAAELKARGARTRIETELVHGTYWIPIGLACAIATIAAAAGRTVGTVLAGLAGLSVTDDLSIGRRPLRRLLGQRPARNVIAEYGPHGDAPTLIIHAHHDAAHTGLVFHPALAKLAASVAGGLIERVGGTPAPMWGAVVGPAAVALGQLLRIPRVTRLGALVSAGYTAAMLDIWRRPTVPGANDNLSSICALVLIAEDLVREPTRRVRVVLLSSGSEESFLEGMVRFGERHFPTLSPQSTTFLGLESIGSPQLMLLSGEGLLRLRHYPKELIEKLTALAQEQGIRLREPFRYRLATNGQVPLRAGYPTAVISSMDWYKAPSNYHWPSDQPQNLDRENICNTARLALAFARALDHEDW